MGSRVGLPVVMNITEHARDVVWESRHLEVFPKTIKLLMFGD